MKDLLKEPKHLALTDVGRRGVSVLVTSSCLFSSCNSPRLGQLVLGARAKAGDVKDSVYSSVNSAVCGGVERPLAGVAEYEARAALGRWVQFSFAELNWIWQELPWVAEYEAARRPSKLTSVLVLRHSRRLPPLRPYQLGRPPWPGWLGPCPAAAGQAPPPNLNPLPGRAGPDEMWRPRGRRTLAPPSTTSIGGRTRAGSLGPMHPRRRLPDANLWISLGLADPGRLWISLGLADPSRPLLLSRRRNGITETVSVPSWVWLSVFGLENRH